MMPKVERDSNIELLRIAAMLLIIVHHAVLHGGIRTFDSGWSYVALGLWGKAAINAFVMITGYFMCESRLTLKRYWKVIGPALFYITVFWALSVFTGYEKFSVKSAVDTLLWPVRGVNGGFVASFCWFYLAIPFLNIIIASGRRNLLLATGFLLGLEMVLPTFFFNHNMGSDIAWFAAVYFIGALIRREPMPWMSSNRICLPALAGLMVLSFASVAAMHFIVGKNDYLLTGRNGPLGLLVGVFAFLAFRNLRIGNSRIINLLASCAWAVLLIHTANDGVRRFLWQDCFNIHSLKGSSQPVSIIAIVGISVAIYLVCSALDLVLKYLYGLSVRRERK